jgi:hypothetical protein
LRRVIGLALFAICCGTGCSLLFGVSADDYVGGPSDGGSPPRDRDGDPDAAGPADSTTSSVTWDCGAPICDDFERDAAAHDEWTVELDGGYMEMDPNHSNATPYRALHVHVGTESGPNTRSALLSNAFHKASRVRCSFSVLLNDPGPGPDTIDLLLVSAKGAGRPGISSMRFGVSGTFFSVRQDTIQEDGGCHCPSATPFYFESVKAPAPPKSPWRKVTIDTTMQHTTVAIDDFVKDFDFEAFPLEEARIQIGILDFAGGTTADFDLDDLACTVTP